MLGVCCKVIHALPLGSGLCKTVSNSSLDVPLGNTSISLYNACFGSELTHNEPPQVFCNICWQFKCHHSPSTSFNNKVYYPTSCLAPCVSSGPKFPSDVASFTTLSFNVYSLKEVEEDCHDSPDGLDYKSRALLVERIRDKGYTACCFQETRTAQREFSVPGFFCVASGHFNKNMEWKCG